MPVAIIRSMDNRGKKFSAWMVGVGALTTVLVSGCGNFGRGYMSRRSISGQIFGSSVGAGGLALGQVPAEVATTFNCPSPALDNVSIQRGEVSTSRNRFVACPAKANTNDVALIAETTELDVCVFPVQEISETAIFLKMELASQLPLFQCARMGRSPSQVGSVSGVFSFPATNFNAVIVAKQEDRDRMLRCLTDPAAPSQGMQTCPEFSYGSFRANQ